MTWTAAMIAIPLVCYLGAAVAYGIQGNWPLCIVYGGYSFSQVGLLWLDRLLTK